jgi:hypothetical protein
MLAKRLTRRGVMISGTSVVAALWPGSVSASVPPALVATTIKTASLFTAGKAATTGVISAKVAALTEGMVRAMFLAKVKTVTSALALSVLVALGGVRKYIDRNDISRPASVWQAMRWSERANHLPIRQQAPRTCTRYGTTRGSGQEPGVGHRHGAGVANASP